ncbi:zinc dependent phospholipase C family protein [Paenibacillus mendelii]|uniref:Zinc dependent phospholipase C family protein n=1 Tax=Paenibacillus mendelii TaxID=206163 RepID=A0ABV6JF49_9BACL|nr:zinc dependent phospholipase C family protein [Paenibacillus mendelii]MCQ6557420.1 zinc dependent phospholipase C family protein [Paenibacillus mendelii]
MGSRMMHLIISDQVCSNLHIDHRSAFLLGGIAPDACTSHDQKNISHYFEGSLEDGTRHINYDRFIDQYRSELKDEYLLGYLSHLIADDVWMKFIYFKHDFKNRLDRDPSLYERWHGDFRKLNGRLIIQYDCSRLRDELIASHTTIELDEIHLDDLERFKEEALMDFSYREDQLEQELLVFSFDEILSYIERSAELATKVCSAIQLEGSKTRN